MVSELYKKTASALKSGGVEDYSFETDAIFRQVFSKDFKKDLIMERLDSDGDSVKIAEVDRIVSRRLSGEPLQYILGEWEFYGIEFYVGKGVLIPRQDTETLVDISLRLLNQCKCESRDFCPHILDLCSGSGCVAIAIASNLKNHKTVAAELYDDALYYLQKNIKRHCGAGVTAVKLDALSEESAGSFSQLDLITCNPPYLNGDDMLSLQKEVKFEPKTALYGESDGLHYYREISHIWKPAIKPGGYIAFEIGYTQTAAVSEILQNEGYRGVTAVNDLAGKQRVIYGQKA